MGVWRVLGQRRAGRLPVYLRDFQLTSGDYYNCAPRSLCILSLICSFEADSVNTAVALCGCGATFVTQGPKIPSLVFWLF